MGDFLPSAYINLFHIQYRLDEWCQGVFYSMFIYCLPSSVGATSLSAGSQNIFALTNLDLNFAQLGHNLLGL